ncbi:MAG: sulfite oxidase-like oxidoreductase [Chloroflexi bacterium]|nr:sulfite oxidase-like oxidoreductase [Chloroflexota bacterium]
MSVISDAMERRRLEERMRKEGRLPPGQSLTLKFPVLTYGPTPPFSPDTWDLRVFGEVKTEKRWTWPEFLALPTVQITCDLHCVTKWSKFDTVWEGVRFRDFVDLFGLTDRARYVIAHCEGGYTTNTPLEVMMDDDVLLTYKYDGQWLEADHGFPLRTLVPKRYLWKSAKWVRALEFSAHDKPGFWEQGGYHNEGEPFKEERFNRRGMFF